MSKRPTVAQSRLITAADANTGLLRGSQAVLDALCAQGLAVRHPRPPHRCYLTPAGLALRTELLAPPAPSPVEPPPEVATFAARTGHETAATDDPRRAREVGVAWEGLLELRRVTNRGVTDLPCPWERGHLVPAAALALEAAGCRPAVIGGVDGYRVGPAPQQPEAVRVDRPGGSAAGVADSAADSAAGSAAGTASCAAALERAGWQVTEHPDGAGGRFLLASPRRA